VLAYDVSAFALSAGEQNRQVLAPVTDDQSPLISFKIVLFDLSEQLRSCRLDSAPICGVFRLDLR
jgi:hypothetical protein